MLSVAPNIVFAPNMTQNAERKHRTQNTNTAPIRPPPFGKPVTCPESHGLCRSYQLLLAADANVKLLCLSLRSRHLVCERKTEKDEGCYMP